MSLRCKVCSSVASPLSSIGLLNEKENEERTKSDGCCFHGGRRGGGEIGQAERSAAVPAWRRRRRRRRRLLWWGKISVEWAICQATAAARARQGDVWLFQGRLDRSGRSGPDSRKSHLASSRQIKGKGCLGVSSVERTSAFAV